MVASWFKTVVSWLLLVFDMVFERCLMFSIEAKGLSVSPRF